MSAVAFPTVAVTVPARRRHLAAVPELPAAPAALPAAPAATAAPLRLTDRGRAVLVVLAFVLAAAFGAGVGLALPTQEAAPEQVQSVTVGPGESLWTVAESVAAEGQDVRVVIDQIVALNNLSAATVHVGQELTVPAER